ncbi:hypothetical protein LOZ61_004298 [Ophidiomyces ophidiicola]|nr:hypothetical protein LOZ61_004298 [Ophidiomyces ophidiicola]KAI1925782.1 hypothetical protein LOZ60_003940 [Ophidiomyces ophidiicola]KAI1955849.1 hypothetical protein LOZ59_004419 [Ophidiomyces ophidiicola]KAI2139078.1 hypothetical protein LOZ27_005327 [Ophidiomyces ophidiicola]KAI2238951.1 hypothetical protein LOZ13_003660 [Ophidiomyces ophidiicola]
MPSPGVAHRPSNRGSASSPSPKPKRLDLGEPLGPYDNNTVREKVRKWQQQGGGVVIAQDVGASDDDIDKGSKESDKKKQHRGKDDSRKAGEQNSEGEKKPKAEGRARPKKRVVSDAHWRKDRTPPESPSPTKSTSRKYRESPKKQDQKRKQSEEKKETSTREPKRYTVVQTNDGMKVYPGPLKNSKSPQAARRSDASGRGTPSPNSKEKRYSTSARREVRAKYVVNDFPYKSDASRAHESSDGASFSGKENRMATPESKTPTRTTKLQNRWSIDPTLGEQKKKNPKLVLPPGQQSHGSKVEAWLSKTSDPFVDDEPPMETPSPLKSSNDRRSGLTTGQNSDSMGSQSAVEEYHAAPKRRSRTSNKFQEDSGKVDNNFPKGSFSERENDSNIPVSKSSPKISSMGKHPKCTEDRKMSMLCESVEEAIQASCLDRPVSSDGSEVSLAERPPPLTLRRPFPGTGVHILSTIASVDTLASTVESERSPMKRQKSTTGALEQDDVSESEARDQFDPYSLPGPSRNTLKRRLTTHSDLMSVLSLPTGSNRSIRSARSIRTNRSRLATATVGDIMREFASDEIKYMRELRTLVGGVIPVLLTSVLSKTDSAVAAGLFRPSAKADEDNFTRPIVNMGISLEKLKSSHKRAPLKDPDALLTWAQGVHKVYADYLAAWRLGFQDVVVNLAPPDPDDSSKGPNSDVQSLYAGMSQDENGDVVDGDGERVDVAFLLKRPLVRMKYLAKTFKGLNYLQPSPKAVEIEKKYQSLVTDARRRANEERARLEDEAANSVDVTRARDIHTLTILTNINVNQSRRVRARDFFDLSFLHSTGQQIDCRAELLFRDNATNSGPGGDLFVCEVDNAGRWLLFPPIDHGRLSARNGNGKGEIVIMVRGVPEEGGNWHELLTLRTEDEHIGSEWVQILGLSPVPPKINRSLSFVNRAKQKKPAVSIDIKRSESVLSAGCIVPSPTDIGVPVGENGPVSIDEGTACGIDCTMSRDPVSFEPSKVAIDSATIQTQDVGPRTPRTLNEAMEMAGGTSPTTLKRSKAKRRSKYEPLSPIPSLEDIQTPEREAAASGTTEPKSHPREPELARSVSPEFTDIKTFKYSEKSGKKPIAEVTRPLSRRSLSPVPSLELPSIPKLRKGAPKLTSPSSNSPIAEPVSPSPKTKLQKQRKQETQQPFIRSESNDQLIFTEDVPVPPPHRSPSPSRSDPSSPSNATPTFSPWARHRRTSSPLKHEYEPSTATESTVSETSTVEHHSIYSSSETSDEELEDKDVSRQASPVSRTNMQIPPSSLNIPEETLAPSNSASQAPYKTVPSQPSKASKAIASIYFWDDSGSWKALHAEECNVVVTPGLIEAYEISPAHGQQTLEPSADSCTSDKSSPLGRPLIALELTPLVPIRRGTALDISIRSPPTSNSKLVYAGSNIMFRSRSPDECDTLYGFINHSRINNPTYVALQNARGPYSNQPTSLARYNSTRSTKGSSWFGWYGGLSKNSYRASSAPPASVAGVTDSSVGTMASAFSAIKRFGAGSKMFSIAKSTLTSRTGSRGGSMHSMSTRSGSVFNSNGKSQEVSKSGMGGIGLKSAKIRLYCRESASKWRDMGAARLTILPVSPSSSRPGTSSNSVQNSASATENEAPVDTPITRQLQKRILIHGKAHGQVLVDACLGESCFERVARTGIAVSVWEEFQGVAKEGGVVGGSFKVYMIQMKSEAETAYTFGLVGKLRY